MKKNTLITLLILFAIAASAWTPANAAASTTASSSGETLTITNPMPKATVVTLRGSADYTFTVPANQTITKTIPKGSYRYKYLGCQDKTFSGILPYKNGSYVLDIKPCKVINLHIFSPFATDYISTLKGWMNYQLNVRAGQWETFNVVAGTYYLKYTCGTKSWEGKVRLQKNILWVMCDR